MRASARCFAPSGPTPLPSNLQTGVKRTRQRVLTAGRRARGAVLDGGQGGIRLEEVSHNLCALHLQVVSTQPANESQRDASRGIDTFVQRQAQNKMQAGKRVAKGRACAAAYRSSRSVKLVLRLSAICLAPSAPILLSPILQDGGKHKKRRRQGLLTLGKRVCSDVLKCGEGGIGLEHL